MATPSPAGKTWALLLAAGDGTRLHHLTRGADGVPVPKQFCSLDGEASLLRLTRARARRVVAESRIVTVVSAWHERWWRAEMDARRTGNVVVQPDNRGTAVGLLVPLLEILARDPDARVWVLPSDHWVGDERRLVRSVRKALGRVEHDPAKVVMLGIAPDAPDSQYGWIIPGDRDADGFSAVSRFVEKPPADEASLLLESGGLWNSFLLVARARALVALYEHRLPALLATLRATSPGRDLAAVYDSLPPLDFSKDVLQGSEESLLLLRVPACGWSDLGTPERLLACLASLRGSDAEGIPPAANADVSLWGRRFLPAGLTARG